MKGYEATISVLDSINLSSSPEHVCTSLARLTEQRHEQESTLKTQKAELLASRMSPIELPVLGEETGNRISIDRDERVAVSTLVPTCSHSYITREPRSSS